MTQPPIVPGQPQEPQWEQPQQWPASPPPYQPYQQGYPPPPYQQQPYGYDPNQHIQVIARPGGLSGAAHAVHILICFFTCGLWLVGYAIFVATAPNQRFDVVAPFGADPQLVARARLEAEARAKVPGWAQPGATHALPPQPMSDRAQNLVWITVTAVLGLTVLVGVFVIWG